VRKAKVIRGNLKVRLSGYFSPSLRGVSDEAIPDLQVGYAGSTPFYSLCTVWDCFVPRNNVMVRVSVRHAVPLWYDRPRQP